MSAPCWVYLGCEWLIGRGSIDCIPGESSWDFVSSESFDNKNHSPKDIINTNNSIRTGIRPSNIDFIKTTDAFECAFGSVVGKNRWNCATGDVGVVCSHFA